MFNSAIYDNTAVKLAFYYQGTKIDDWGLTTRNRTSTTYSTMSEQDCDAIGFTVKSGVTVDFTISPEFTNDGVLPTEFEPYGWKVPFENRGENLLDYSTLANDYTLNAQTGLPYSFPKRIATLTPIDVSTLTSVTLSYQSEIENTMFIYAVFNGNTLVSRVASNHSGDTIDVSGGDNLYVSFYSQPDNISIDKVFNIMLTPGSEAKPYSPYLNETLPVYLGEVPTVRRVKKLVLDGTENWRLARSGGLFVYSGIQDYYRVTGAEICLISHYTAQPNLNSNTQVLDKHAAFYSNPTNAYNDFYMRDSDYEDASAWKVYLAQQYAAGHPVTIWYVLANEQTAISNEPLCKISTYADELTTIQVHGLSAPLYGIGDYKDTLNLSTGIVTRKVKKLVLTGNENWAIWSSGQPDVERYYYKWGKTTPSGYGLICTHLPFRNADGNFEHIRLGGSSRDDFVIYISKTIASTVADFKSYLAAQYQAGTPVIAWYVLSTPETETVTVPTGMTGEIEGYLTQVSTPTPTNQSVPKWNGVEETGGTYAVTVYTPPEIPTTTGENTLTVDTALAPSSLTVKGHIKELT